MKNNYIRFKNCIVATALILTIPMLVFAGSTGVGNKGLSIGPRMVYSTPKDADSGQWSVGAQARLHLSPGLGLEGSIDSRSNSFLNVTTIKTYPVQASLLAYLMPGAFLSPYLIGGAGLYYTQVNGPFGYSNTNSRFGTHLGAGVELMVNEFISLDGGYRYVWLESVASTGTSNVLDKSYQDSGSMLTIALNFLF